MLIQDNFPIHCATIKTKVRSNILCMIHVIADRFDITGGRSKGIRYINNRLSGKCIYSVRDRPFLVKVDYS